MADEQHRALAGPVRAAEIMQAEREFLAAVTAVWREIDRLEAEPGGYHPAEMSVHLRHRERDTWRKYRDLLDAGNPHG